MSQRVSLVFLVAALLTITGGVIGVLSESSRTLGYVSLGVGLVFLTLSILNRRRSHNALPTHPGDKLG